MKFRLCDEDRKRFGIDDEWLEWSVWDISVADLDELSERFGFDVDDWPDPYFGQLTLEQAGNPDAEPKPPRWQRQAWAWMLLHQNGFPVSWDEAGEVRILRATSQKQDEPGKDQPEPSPSSEPSTTPPSPSSSASRKTKSAA